MKQNVNLDGLVMCVFLAIVGAILTFATYDLGGIELLLAGVVLALLIEGALTAMFSYKWYGLFYHLLWASIFYWCYSKEQGVFEGWQWYLLWGLLVIRILVLQPIYLKKISKKPKF